MKTLLNLINNSPNNDEFKLFWNCDPEISSSIECFRSFEQKILKFILYRLKHKKLLEYAEMWLETDLLK